MTEELPAIAPQLESFKGSELTSVNVWKFGVTLAFNDEVRTVTIEGPVEFCSRGHIESYNQEIIVAFGARVLSLMGRSVVELRSPGDHVLSFEFDEGTTLTLRPDDTGYECYQIRLPDGTIIVG
jgi:hypothetical protein